MDRRPIQSLFFFLGILSAAVPPPINLASVRSFIKQDGGGFLLLLPHFLLSLPSLSPIYFEWTNLDNPDLRSGLSNDLLQQLQSVETKQSQLLFFFFFFYKKEKIFMYFGRCNEYIRQTILISFKMTRRLLTGFISCRPIIRVMKTKIL